MFVSYIDIRKLLVIFGAILACAMLIACTPEEEPTAKAHVALEQYIHAAAENRIEEAAEYFSAIEITEHDLTAAHAKSQEVARALHTTIQENGGLKSVVTTIAKDSYQPGWIRTVWINAVLTFKNGTTKTEHFALIEEEKGTWKIGSPFVTEQEEAITAYFQLLAEGRLDDARNFLSIEAIAKKMLGSVHSSFHSLSELVETTNDAILMEPIASQETKKQATRIQGNGGLDSVTTALVYRGSTTFPSGHGHKFLSKADVIIFIKYKNGNTESHKVKLIKNFHKWKIDISAAARRRSLSDKKTPATELRLISAEEAKKRTE